MGLEPIKFIHDLERRALERTRGVILFQDQINQVAHDVGGISHSEADRLRRAFTKRNNGPIIQAGGNGPATERGPGRRPQNGPPHLRAFNGHYMFPESHAFAFGVTAYQISWLKCYYPLEFYLGLFNQQPMGFYNPETLKEDAKRHGISVFNPDVNLSAGLCTIESEESDGVRLGLSYVKRPRRSGHKRHRPGPRSGRKVSQPGRLHVRSGLEQQQVEDPDRRWSAG